MRVLLLAAALACATPGPTAQAQHQPHAKAHGHKADHAGHGAAPPQPGTHDGTKHDGMKHGGTNHGGMKHDGMAHDAPAASAPDAAPESAVPARALDGPRHAANAIWGAEAMAPSRRQLVHENGGMTTGMVLLERLEAGLTANGGADVYVWDAQAWYGGDLDRLVLKTEGEGTRGDDVEDAEIQVLYGRAIGPFFDLQAGLRVDVEPEARGHAVFGLQGLLPFMVHVDGALFLSDRGDLTARLEGEYDLRVTQRLILQPRLEVEFAAQDIAERDLGAGVTKIEPGLRLRFEITREVAPYLGVEYEAKLGETANIARATGNDPDQFKLLIGLRAWY